MRFIFALIVSAALFPATGAFAQVCTIKAGVKSCPNDVKAKQPNGATVASDQSTATKSGSTILFNDGSSTIMSGNAIFFQDGTSAIRSGDVTFFNDGRICFRQNGVIFCN